MNPETRRKADEAADLILAAPSTAQEWARRPGELIHAAYVVARAWRAAGGEAAALAGLILAGPTALDPDVHGHVLAAARTLVAEAEGRRC